MNGLLSLSHLLGISATVLAIGILVPLTRVRPGCWVAAVRWGLALVLLLNIAGLQVMFVRHGSWSVSGSLPLYICDVASIEAALALAWPTRILVELSWFLAIGAALPGVIIPDHTISFPSYDWLQYYIEHGGTVAASALLVFGLRLHPQRRAPLRVIPIIFVSIAAVGAVDAATGGNYDYLRPMRVPAGSLLNAFGPWPWYILLAAAGEAMLLTLIDVPFWPERHRSRVAESYSGQGR